MLKSLLVVDDQPGIRLLLTEVFTNEGYRVTTAKTGQEGLDKIYIESFDLILLDYKLPVVDGAQVLKQLNVDKIKTPVVVMSGLAESIAEDIQNYSSVKRVMAKPFDIQDICETVKSIFDKG